MAKLLKVLLVILFTCNFLHSQETGQSGYQAALEAAGRKNYSKSIEQLSQIINLRPSFSEACFRLADLYLFSGNLELGQAYFTDAIKTNPGNPALYAGTAFVAKHQRDWSGAFENCKLALEKGAAFPETVDLLVESALEIKQTQALAKILAGLNGRESQKHLYDLGYTIWRLRIENFKKAKSTIDSYLKVNENDYFGHMLRGEIAQKQKDFENSNLSFHRALQLIDAEKLHHKIGILGDLAFNHNQMNRPDSAEYYLSEASTQAREIGALQNLLEINYSARAFYREYGMLQRLADVSLEAAEICATLNLTGELSALYFDLGRVHNKMRDYERALKYYLQALASANPENSALQAKAHAEIGGVYFRYNQLQPALEHLELSVATAKKAGAKNVEYAALMTIADVYQARQNFDEARSTYSKVLRYGQRTQQHEITEQSFIKLSHLFLVPENENLEHAQYFLNLAIALARQTFQLQFAANHRWMQGRIALRKNDIEKAELYFVDAIQLARETGVSFSYIAGHAGLVQTYLQAKFYELASAHADSVLHYLADFSICMDDAAVIFFDLRRELFEPVLTAYSNMGYLEKIFETCERFKALIHFLDIEPVKYKIESPEFQALWLELETANKQVKEKWRKIWNLWEQDQKDHLELIMSIKNEIGIKYSGYQKTLAQIEEKYPATYAIIHPVEPQSLSAVQSKLKELNSTFIHYAVLENATIITVVTPEKIKSQRVNKKRRQLENLVLSINPLFANKWGVLNNTDAFSMVRTGELYLLLFESIRPWIPAGSNIIISPDGILNRLPFEALVTNSQNLIDEFDYMNAKFLVEDFAISYVPFSGFLDFPQRHKTKTGKTLAAFANSSLRPPPAQILPQQPANRKSARNTEKEVADVLEAIGEGDLFLGGNSTKKAFLNEAGNYQIIHLATPGLLQDRFSLSSKIYFSNAGVLQPHELFNLELNGGLVVLSSIERVFASRNGFNTWLHGFTFSGISAILAAQWQPGEGDHSELISQFYSNLKEGMDKADALRQAKITFINTTERNPYYWASLSLYGDIGAIKIQPTHTAWLFTITFMAVLVLVWSIVWHFIRIRREKRAENRGQLNLQLH